VDPVQSYDKQANISGRPIADKYREGKMKRTLRRGLKAPEIVGREALKGGCSQKKNVLSSCPVCYELKKKKNKKK